MFSIENAIETVNEIVVIPVVIITFGMLLYLSNFLRTENPDPIKAKIFLRYDEFKKSFYILSVFAFILILHVSFIYLEDLFNNEFFENIQHFFGILLALTLICFVYMLLIIIRIRKIK